MPIVIDYRRKLYRPVVICDHCGERIKEGAEANYLWCGYADGRMQNKVPLFYLHWTCERAFRETHPEVIFARERLAVLPTMLKTNLNLSEKVIAHAVRLVRWLNSWRIV